LYQPPGRRIGKSYRGAFNDTTTPTMAAPVIKEVIQRAKVEPVRSTISLWGPHYRKGRRATTSHANVPLPPDCLVSISGQTIDRQCSSGLMSVSMAAKQIIVDGMQTVIAGGVESISLVQNEHQNIFHKEDALALKHAPDLYMAMIDTAEVVSKRYKISREAQDEYSLLSQQRTAEAQQAGRFDAEIIPMTVTKVFQDKDNKAVTRKEITIDRDECNRPSTTLSGLAALPPVMGPGKFITAGNASSSPMAWLRVY
jgi:acetyl-CoA C-acetyltransferase